MSDRERRKKKKMGEGVWERRRQTEYFRQFPKEGVETTKVTWEEFLLETNDRKKEREIIKIKKGCHQSPIEQCFNHFQLGLTLLNICSPFSVKWSCDCEVFITFPTSVSPFILCHGHVAEEPKTSNQTGRCRGLWFSLTKAADWSCRENLFNSCLLSSVLFSCLFTVKHVMISGVETCCANHKEILLLESDVCRV